MIAGSKKGVNIPRIKQILAERGVSATRVAKEAGLGNAALNQMLNGIVDEPRLSSLRKIAKALSVPLDEITHGYVNEDEISLSQSAAKNTKHQRRQSGGRTSTTLTPVRGDVEAGVFRSIGEQGGLEMLPVVDVGLYGAAQFAYRVRGDSMDLAGLSDGTYAIAVEFSDLDEELVDGMVVIAERRSDNATVETAAWIIRLYPNRTEFHPHSSNPAHKPITVEGRLIGHGGPVSLIGRVVQSVKPIRIFPRKTEAEL